MNSKKIIFIADVHLGLRIGRPELLEKRFADFLNSLGEDIASVFLLGDIFDFWYEYRDVIPRGYTRTLGALAALVDRGVDVHFFPGNHDIWAYDYFEMELGLKVHRCREAERFVFGGRSFLIGHGDLPSNNKRSYELLYSIFHCKLNQRLFSAIHPRWAFAFAHSWSRHNRLLKDDEYIYKDEVTEPIFKWALKQEAVDYIVMGHLHSPLEKNLSNGSRLFILGDWIRHSGCLVFDGESLIFSSFS